MTAAPRSASQPRTRPRFTPNVEEIERWLESLFGDDEGLIEIAVGKTRPGDPSKIDAYPPKPAWNEGHRFRVYSAATRHQLACDIAKLIQKYGNVYISKTLYRSPQRSAEVALPSDNVFIDDVDPSTDVSILVQTSERSFQGILKLSTKEDAATIRELGERIAKAVSGTKGEHADTCYAVTALIRVPTGYNTKHYKNFQTRVVSKTGKTFSVDELRARYPEVASKAASIAADLAWSEVAHCLANIDGITKRIKVSSLTYKHLHSDGFALGSKGEGGRSKLRYALACNLRSKFGCPDEEIAAMLWHFNWGHLEEKGSDWLKADIDRCVSFARGQYPNVETTPSYCRLDYHNATPAQPLPQIERKRRGRQTRLTDEQYLEALKHDADSGTVQASQSDLAARYGVGVATIRRIEKRLQVAGLIERRTVRKRGGTYSYIVFSAITNSFEVAIKDNQSAGLVLSPEAPEAQQHAEKCEAQSVVESTHRPEGAAQDTPTPSAGQAVNAMREAGATRRRGKMNLYRMLDAHFPDHGWSLEEIDRAYDAQRKTKNLQAARERLLQRLENMKPKELSRAMHNAEFHIAESHEQETEQWKFWCMYRDRCYQKLRQLNAKAAPKVRIPGAQPLRVAKPTIAADTLSGGCVSLQQPAKMVWRPTPRLTTTDTFIARITPEKERFVLEQLGMRGADWARGYMERVEGFDRWPLHVRHAVVQLEEAQQGGQP